MFNPSPNHVANVLLTLTGASGDSVITDSSGTYSFLKLALGSNFTVTPTKASLAPGSSGITTADAIAIQRHFLNSPPLLTGCALTAADVTGDGVIDTHDLMAIQRFILGYSIGIANVGAYRFNPTSRTYQGLITDQTDQNYDVLVLGDVAAPFVDQ